MRKIAIAGFGLEGRSAYAFLKGTAELHIFDEREVGMSGVEATFHQGLTIPADIDVVYKAPGIPTHKLLLESEETRVTTLMDDVLAQVGLRAIGVTGTKGKSTVSALIHHILVSSGKQSVLFGNIGVADMNLVASAPKDAVFVIELSSYQLEHVTHAPHVAVFTSFFPEHLSHHGSLEAYRDAKLNIVRFQSGRDVFVNGTDIGAAFAGREVRPHYEHFETKLLGEHNQKNCGLAAAAVREFGVYEEEARKHIATFEPLPYRLEKVGEYRGVTFYDDSLATIPQATLASIASLPRVDSLIVGGEDRGIPFDDAAEALAQTQVQTFISFPDTGAKLTAQTKRRVVPVTNMEEAVRTAYEYTPAGGVVLLSNASPSFNLFKDYKDKSAQYRDWIKKLA